MQCLEALRTQSLFLHCFLELLLLLLAEGWVPSETSLKRESFNDIAAAFAVSCSVSRLRYLVPCAAYMGRCKRTHIHIHITRSAQGFKFTSHTYTIIHTHS